MACVFGTWLVLLAGHAPLHAQPVGAEAAATSDDPLDDDGLFADEDLADDDFAEDDQSDEDVSPDATNAAEAKGEGNAPPAEAAAAPNTEEIQPPAIGPSEGVEEILVHGQAAAGIEVDATVSVTQFDAQDLDALGVEDISDVAQFTPNLEIRTGGATAPTFFIRGIGLNDFTANAAGAIAIYQDDVAFSLPAIQLGQLFDIEELEILRGPQGAGAARNASGGAIKTYSRKPTGELGGRFEATFARFDQQTYEGALEIPLIEDILSSRFAFITNWRDPFVQNRCAGVPKDDLDRITDFLPNGDARRTQPRHCESPITRRVPNPFSGSSFLLITDVNVGLEDELDDQNRWATRGQLRLVPRGVDMEWLLNVHGGKIDQFSRVGQPIGTVGRLGGKSFGGETSRGYRAREITKEEDRIFARLGGVGFDPVLRERAQEILAKRLARRLDEKPFKGDYNRNGKERMETVGGSLRGDWELGWGHVTSISAMERYDRSRQLDADYTSDVIFEFLIEDRAWQFSQELQLEGELDGYPLHWETGVLYLMDQLDYAADTLVSAPTQPLTQIYDQETRSLVAFAGFAWDFLDDFTLEAGARFNWERKRFEIDLRRANVPICEDVICKDRQTWQAPTGTIKLSYHFREDVVAYASYNRGFKSGQFSVGGASGDAFTVADPESVDAFEAGLKGSFLDGRLELQAALFHYTYQNYQVFLAANDAFTPPQRVVVNADDAVLYGGELETVLVPFQGIDFLESFQFTSRLGWIESEFLDFNQRIFRQLGLTPGDPILAVDIDWTGNRLPNTPRFKWSGTLEYSFDMGRYGSLIPRWDWAWTADAFFDASDGRGIPNNNGRSVLPEYAIGQPAYWIHRVRLSWRNAEGSIEIAGWVDNVADEVYKTLAFDASEGANLVGNQVGDPRTYGVTFSFEW